MAPGLSEAPRVFQVVQQPVLTVIYVLFCLPCPSILSRLTCICTHIKQGLSTCYNAHTEFILVDTSEYWWRAKDAVPWHISARCGATQFQHKLGIYLDSAAEVIRSGVWLSSGLAVVLAMWVWQPVTSQVNKQPHSFRILWHFRDYFCVDMKQALCGKNITIIDVTPEILTSAE